MLVLDNCSGCLVRDACSGYLCGMSAFGVPVGQIPCAVADGGRRCVRGLPYQGEHLAIPPPPHPLLFIAPVCIKAAHTAAVIG